MLASVGLSETPCFGAGPLIRAEVELAAATAPVVSKAQFLDLKVGIERGR